MSAIDPVALLAQLDRPVSPRPEFKAALRAQLLTELQAPPSITLPRRLSFPVPAVRRWSRLRLAIVVIALFLLLAGVATATYLAVQAWGGGEITLLHGRISGRGVDSISGIGPDGRIRTLWRCPGIRFCGDLVSIAWAPDGRRMAISLTVFGGLSRYPGLHIINLVTGRDRRVTSFPPSASNRKFGCVDPGQLAWSPDGSKIAYACAITRNGWRTSQIYLIDANGSHPSLLRTGTSGAAWPSWSPTGTRIAFSTAASLVEHVRTDTRQPDRIVRSLIYTVDLNGARRRLIANDAAAPAWSPDGQLIAYRSACGRVQLATPDGRHTPRANPKARCTGIGRAGWPTWAPDGSRIAIGTSHGIYLINPDGTHLNQISTSSSVSATGTYRPAWQPARRKTR